ncbi:zinc finger protein OZF [Culicoides brevitarsis]|uniref:zinc finger protein OZF n=1 Tax=Culicoides brevitarsis TaxID=469753 RepID=UPI00307B723B
MEIEFLTVNPIDFGVLKEPEVTSSCCGKYFSSLESLLDHFELHHYSILKEIVRKRQNLFLRCLNDEEFEEKFIKTEESEVPEEQPEAVIEKIPEEKPKIEQIPSPLTESSEEEKIEFNLPKRSRVKKKKDPPDARRFECNKCGKVFIGYEIFQRHEKRHSGYYICDFCDKKFFKKNKLESHFFTHKLEKLENKNLGCKLCEIIFNDELEKELHLQEFHIQSSEMLECHLCPTLFTNKFQLVSHVRRIHEKKPTFCKYCSNKFKTTEDLERHISQEHQNETILCSHCGKSFNGKHLLHKHMSELQKKFKCVVCEKAFNQKYKCEVHQINVHGLGEKPFVCVTCNKGFAKLSDLKSHEISHSDATPFQCDQCPMAFKRRNHLTAHVEKNHTENVEAECILCQKILKSKHSMRSHAKKVHKMTMNEMYKKAGIPYNGRDCVWSKFYQNRKPSDIRISVD